METFYTIQMKILMIFLFFTSALCADVKSTKGQIGFDTQSDGQTEMVLNATGLGVGLLPFPTFM